MLDAPSVRCRPVVCAGKSFLLNRIIDALRQRHGGEFSKCVAVTAATGIAATHIGGALFMSCRPRHIQCIYRRRAPNRSSYCDHAPLIFMRWRLRQTLHGMVRRACVQTQAVAASITTLLLLHDL